MSPDIDELLSRTARPALVAEEVHRPESGVLCRQGPPLAEEHETWPLRDETPLLPLLSIHVRELPIVPIFLARFDYWTFFIEPETCEQMAKDGSLVVRKYQRSGGLRQLAPPASIDPEAVGLRFREVIDYPSEEALYSVWSDRPELLQAHQSRADEMRERYPCHSGIKLGGYPYLIQPTAFLMTLDPDFQIQIDISDYFHFGDSGIGYICLGMKYACWETL